jgi:hypothetical protein
VQHTKAHAAKLNRLKAIPNPGAARRKTHHVRWLVQPARDVLKQASHTAETLEG